MTFGFALTYLIGNIWGADANGRYALITQTALFASIVAVGGLDLATVRFLSGPISRGNRVAFSSLTKLLAIGGAFALLAVVAVQAVSALAIVNFGVAGNLTLMLFVLSCLIMARAFTRLASAILRANRNYVLGQMVDAVIIPVVVVSTVLFGITSNVHDLFFYTVVASILAAAIGLAFSFSLVASRGGSGGEAIAISALVLSSMSLSGVAVSLAFADWYGLIIVSSFGGIADAGLYRVAFQIASALAIISVGLLGVFSARFGAAHAAGDMQGFARLMRSSTRLSIICTLPPVLLIAIFASQILNFIGPEFLAARYALWILLFGQAVGVIVGPVGLALAMSGHEKTNLSIAAFSITFIIVAAPIGQLMLGLEGVALALATAQIARNIASLLATRKLLKIDSFKGEILVG